MSAIADKRTAASSRGHLANSGNGPSFVPVDIGHAKYIGLLAADTAFWSLVKKEQISDQCDLYSHHTQHEISPIDCDVAASDER